MTPQLNIYTFSVAQHLFTASVDVHAVQSRHSYFLLIAAHGVTSFDRSGNVSVSRC